MLFQYENAQIAYPKDTGNRLKELEEYAKSEVGAMPLVFRTTQERLFCP